MAKWSTLFLRLLLAVLISIQNETKPSVSLLWVPMHVEILKMVHVLSTVLFYSVAPITIKSYAVCTNIAGFSTKQMRFCEKYRVILGSVIQGIALGIKECKFQFRKRRWNCTSLLSKPPLFKNHAVGEYLGFEWVSSYSMLAYLIR